MILVKTTTGPSKIQGTGLFADEFIPKGTDIWRFSPDVDTAQDEPADLHFAYISKQTGKYIIPGDDSEFINHSDNPNIGTRYEKGVPEDINFALRDIAKGEELTLDYRSFAQEGVDF